MKGILIKPGKNPERVEVEDGLDPLQKIVGGWIQALPIPERDDATAYIHEEGKVEQLPLNRKATLFMLPVLYAGDYIVGPLLITGFDASKGENRDVPEALYERFGLEAPSAK